MYPANRNSGCSGLKVMNTAANRTAAITSLPISPSHPAASRLFALLPARGDITLAARNAFGTTPINPPNKVGTARLGTKPDPDDRGEHHGSPELREQDVADRFHSPGSGNKNATWPCGRSVAFSRAASKPQGGQKPAAL